MPWTVMQGGGDCGDDEWAVIKDDDSSTAGCHATQEDAEAQRQALYAAEDDDDDEASRLSICQAGAEWEVRDTTGTVVATTVDYGAALAVIAERLSRLARDDEDVADDGLLPERWEDAGGIAFSEETGDGRDFRQVVWTWRNPAESVLPLMLQTETEIGHFGARLAGYMETISSDEAGTLHGAGCFYDSDDGRAARDLLLGGRRFGVSVDGGAVDAEWECEEWDEEGWCLAERTTFTALEIIGLTLTPFPAFARAAIALEGGNGLAASAAPVDPPYGWFFEPEPQADDPRLVHQGGGRYACPLTITPAGQVYGHLAVNGTYHSGMQGQKVTVPRSPSLYARFHVHNVVCNDGRVVATGPFVASSEHALLNMRAPGARDYYAHNALTWSDARVVDGKYGPWASGALRPDVDDLQLRAIRGSSLSGDWRDEGMGLDLIVGLLVNGPAFAVLREAMAASGIEIPQIQTRALIHNGKPVALVAANVVRRVCPSRSDERPRAAYGPARAVIRSAPGPSHADEILGLLRKLERRTRQLIPEAAAYAGRRNGGIAR